MWEKRRIIIILQSLLRAKPILKQDPIFRNQFPPGITLASLYSVALNSRMVYPWKWLLLQKLGRKPKISKEEYEEVRRNRSITIKDSIEDCISEGLINCEVHSSFARFRELDDNDKYLTISSKGRDYIKKIYFMELIGHKYSTFKTILVTLVVSAPIIYYLSKWSSIVWDYILNLFSRGA